MIQSALNNVNRRRIGICPSLTRGFLGEARDRAGLRGLAGGEVEKGLVDPAPAPAFGRVVAFDHRMAGRMEMGAGVAVGRIVAAADGPLTQEQCGDVHGEQQAERGERGAPARREGCRQDQSEI